MGIRPVNLPEWISLHATAVKKQITPIIKSIENQPVRIPSPSVLNLHADGKDDRRHAVPLETALDGKGRFVVEQFLEEADPFKD